MGFFRLLPRALSGLLIALLATGAAYSATFKLLPETTETPVECDLSVEGLIEPGDSDRLKELMGDRSGGKGNPIVACLNSDGGNFAEAIDIAQTFIERAVVTNIRANQSCLSACAVMFMAGMSHSTGGSEIDRRMHVSSRLGFHAPAPMLATGASFDGDDLQASYAAAIEAVGRKLLTLARQRGRRWYNPLIKPSLINEMLIARGKDFFHIDTVRKAAEFEITLDGAPHYDSFLIDDAKSACENGIAQVSDSALADWFFQNSIEAIKEKLDDGNRQYIIDIRPNQSIYCSVTKFPESLSITVNTSAGDMGIIAPWYFALPGDTKIATLAQPGYRGPIFERPNWCLEPKQPAEKTICASRDLLKHDRTIEALYRKRSGSALREEKEKLLQSQRTWLKNRNGCKADYVCLNAIYLERSRELHGSN